MNGWNGMDLKKEWKEGMEWMDGQEWTNGMDMDGPGRYQSRKS